MTTLWAYYRHRSSAERGGRKIGAGEEGKGRGRKGSVRKPE